jgi:hypothetical protein
MYIGAAWNGVGCCPANSVTADGVAPVPLVPWRVRTTTDETPGVVKVVEMPIGTQAVRLWTSDDTLSVALDMPPAPEGIQNNSLVAATDFTRGDTMLPGQWYLLVIPDPGLAHTCQFFSRGSYTQVIITALLGT